MRTGLPNLFILGVAKSGTTTLADSLRRHREIFITPTKEPTFFSSDVNYAKGMEWYLDTYFPKTAKYRYRGDASPSYLYFGEKTARRMRADLSGEALRFLVIFRNPIDRAYSHYWHNVNRGRQEELTFEEALDAEDERLREYDKELNDLGRIRYAYFRAGMYSQQLQTFWMHFEHRQFLLLLYEDLENGEFEKTVNRIQQFLGVPSQTVARITSNPSYRPRSRRVDGVIRGRSLTKNLFKATLPTLVRGRLKVALLRWNRAALRYPPMDPGTRKMLGKRYSAEIREFQSILGRDLSTWLE